jgi:CDP-paratose 2-epimerase
LAVALRQNPGCDVVALDNLKRRGSELALRRLADAGVAFLHGDIREADDLEPVGRVDILIDCAAEPSVQAGLEGGARYLVSTNLVGTFNCLEFARRHRAGFLFLSTSRVYSIPALRSLPLVRQADRLALLHEAGGEGWSDQGIAESFPVTGPRSLYGATKLSAELLVQEYEALHGLPCVVNRCGVIAGPGQMGKVDQGFLVHWAAQHVFDGHLTYNGFGGLGLQVRDVLHPEDLAELVRLQINSLERHAGATYNVGGGPGNGISLRELTALCAAAVGREMTIGSSPDTHPVDVPYYVTDNARVTAATGWRPRRDVTTILGEVMEWLRSDRRELATIFAVKGDERRR